MRKKLKKPSGKMSSWLLIWGLVTIFSYMAPLANPENIPFAVIILLAYPLVLTTNILFSVLFSLRGKYLTAVFPLLLILAGWPLHSKILSMGSSKPAPYSTDLKVVSFNANYGYQLDQMAKDSDHKATDLISYLNEYKKPDVLGIQEYLAPLGEWMKKHYSFKNFVNKSGYRTAIYTDHPILDHGFMVFENYENSVVWADIDFPETGICRIYNIHLQSNQITDKSEQIKKEGLDWSKNSFQSVFSILRNYQNSSALRVGQVQTILDHARGSPFPVIILGDINDVPVSYTYRKLSFGKRDSFLEAEGGLGVTYMGPFPFLRIDVVFSDPQFKTVRHDLIPGRFSDHKPIAVWLRKNKGGF